MNKDTNFFAERMLVSTVKSMRNYNSFLCGDVLRGIEVYHFINEPERRTVVLKNAAGGCVYILTK
jgi:hypothetical protein